MFKLKKLGLISIVLLFSCNIKNINPSTNYSSSQNVNNNYKKSVFEAFQNKYKNIPKYTGDIDVKINTGLLDQNNISKKILL